MHRLMIKGWTTDVADGLIKYARIFPNFLVVGNILHIFIVYNLFSRVSIDGVLGAFAFTISIPLILIGNGLGAFVVRYVTVHGIKWVKKYQYLKNGAMYSIAALGVIMLAESFGAHTASWLPPAITFVVVGIFFWLSKKELQMQKVIKEV